MSESTILAALNALQAGLLAVATEAGLANEFVAGWKNNPTLGGNLNVNDNKIISAEGGSIDLDPENELIGRRLRAPGVMPRILGATNTVAAGDNGRELYSDQSSAYAVTILSDLADWHLFALWSKGSGLPTVSMSGAGTINGAATWTAATPGTYTVFRHLGGNVWVTL